jgi:hypothetical protein
LTLESIPTDVPQICPKCDYVFDHVTAADSEMGKPSPGDFSICLNCGVVLQFSENMTQVDASPEDFEKLEEGDKTLILRIVHAVKSSPSFGKLVRRDKIQ